MDTETLMILAGAAIATAPGWALVWVMVGKQALEMFQTADTQAITEKVNPSLVPK